MIKGRIREPGSIVSLGKSFYEYTHTHTDTHNFLRLWLYHSSFPFLPIHPYGMPSAVFQMHGFFFLVIESNMLSPYNVSCIYTFSGMIICIWWTIDVLLCSYRILLLLLSALFVFFSLGFTLVVFCFVFLFLFLVRVRVRVRVKGFG